MDAFLGRMSAKGVIVRPAILCRDHKVVLLGVLQEDLTYAIEPCKQCLKDAHDEGYDKAFDKGYEQGVKDTEQEK